MLIYFIRCYKVDVKFVLEGENEINLYTYAQTTSKYTKNPKFRNNWKRTIHTNTYTQDDDFSSLLDELKTLASKFDVILQHLMRENNRMMCIGTR